MKIGILQSLHVYELITSEIFFLTIEIFVNNREIAPLKQSGPNILQGL